MNSHAVRLVFTQFPGHEATGISENNILRGGVSDSLGNHVGRRDRACNARLFPFPITPLDDIWRDFVQKKIITRLLARGHLETKRTTKNAPKNTVLKRGKPTAKQPRNTLSRDKAIKGIRQPLRRRTSG